MTSTPLFPWEPFVSLGQSGNPSGTNGTIAQPEGKFARREDFTLAPDETGASRMASLNAQSGSVLPKDADLNDGDLQPSLRTFVLFFTCAFVGLIFWITAITTVVLSGWDALSLLAVYFAVGNAVILGTAVAISLLCSENYDLD